MRSSQREQWERVRDLVQREQATILSDDDELMRLIEHAPTLGRRRASTVRWSRRFTVVGLGIAGAGACALLLFSRGQRVDELRLPAALGVTMSASPGQDLPLHFSDGTTFALRGSSRARLLSVSSNGAHLRLEDGRVDAAVIHKAHSAWSVEAGPFTVKVTGTRFATIWDAARRRFTLSLEEGSVVISGAFLEKGVAMRAPARLFIDVDEEAVSITPAPLAPAPLASVSPSPSERRAPTPGELLPREAPPRAAGARRALSESGARDTSGHGDRQTFERRCAAAGPEALLSLADGARAGGRPAEARIAFESLRQRFPHDARASDAIFGLGVLSMDAAGTSERNALEAIRHFEVYLARWPNGPLAREAAGRLMEAQLQEGRREAAALTARAYLRAHPQGPHAALARHLSALLDRPSGEGR